MRDHRCPLQDSDLGLKGARNIQNLQGMRSDFSNEKLCLAKDVKKQIQ